MTKSMKRFLEMPVTVSSNKAPGMSKILNEASQSNTWKQSEQGSESPPSRVFWCTSDIHCVPYSKTYHFGYGCIKIYFVIFWALTQYSEHSIIWMHPELSSTFSLHYLCLPSLFANFTRKEIIWLFKPLLN